MTGVYGKMVRREEEPGVPDPLVPEPSGGVSLSRHSPKAESANTRYKRLRRLARGKAQVRRGRK